MLSKNAFLLFDAAKVRRFSRPRKSFQRTARFLQQNAYTPIHEVVPSLKRRGFCPSRLRLRIRMRRYGVRADGNLLLVRLHLSIDGLLLGLDHVGCLERTLVLQRTAGQSLTLRVLGDESQVHTGDQVLDAQIQSCFDGARCHLTITLDDRVNVPKPSNFTG